MRWFLFAASMMLLASTPAKGWELNDLNKTVNNTNFVLRGCSGTLVGEKLVLTNHHCIRGYIDRYSVEEVVDGTLKEVRKVRYRDVAVAQHQYKNFQKVGTVEYQSRIVFRDKNRDMALLKIRADLDNIPVELLPEGQSVERGTTAYLVGNPMGADASVVKGTIANVNRMFRVPWANNEEVPFYQFSGGMWFGNSGGALYNDNGYFIGVPAAMGGGGHVGLAIPITVVRGFLKDYRESLWEDAKEEAEETQ